MQKNANQLRSLKVCQEPTMVELSTENFKIDSLSKQIGITVINRHCARLNFLRGNMSVYYSCCLVLKLSFDKRKAKGGEIF